MHIGSSSKMPSTSPDAPFIISSTLTFQNAMGSMLDYIFSGTLERFPELVIAYSEGQVGWMPYVMERADKLWEERSDNSFGSGLRNAPSSFVEHRIYGCVFDDPVGLRNRDVIGMDQICFETDYPHADSTFPHSKKVLSDICVQAGLSEEETYKFTRGNAIRASASSGSASRTDPARGGGPPALHGQRGALGDGGRRARATRAVVGRADGRHADHRRPAHELAHQGGDRARGRGRPDRAPQPPGGGRRPRRRRPGRGHGARARRVGAAHRTPPLPRRHGHAAPAGP